jgi:hypothetical protein
LLSEVVDLAYDSKDITIDAGFYRPVTISGLI